MRTRPRLPPPFLYLIEPLEPRTLLSADPQPLPNPTLEQPSSIVVDFDSVVTTRQVSFHAIAGQTYTFTTYTQTLPGLNLTLTDALGMRLDRWAQSDAVWSAPSDMDIVINLSAANAGGAILTARLMRDEYANLPAFATPIPSVGALTAQGEYWLDVDCFTFNATAGEIYKTTLDAAGPYGNVQITAPDGSIFGADAQQSTSWVAPRTGAYLVAVTYDEGPYTLTQSLVTDDLPNMPSGAQPISPGQTVNISVDYPDDVDYFSFHAQVAQHYVFSSRSYLTLLDQDAQTPLYEDTPSSWDGSTFTPAATGTYFILATGQDAFRSKFAFIKAADDFGDTPATAAPLAFPSRVHGNADFGGDIDVFQFRADPAFVYLFSAMNVDGEALPGEILGPGGSVIVSKQDFKYDDEFSMYVAQFSPEKQGDYDLRLFPPGLFRYTLVASRVSAAELDGRSTATPITPGEITGTLGAPTSIDWYSVQATAGTFLSFEGDTDADFDARILILDSSNHRLPFDHFEQPSPRPWPWGSGGEESYTGWKVPATGTYYLIVFSANAYKPGHYRFNFSSETDDYGGPEHPAPIKLDQLISGRTTGSDDIDSFRLSVRKGSTYALSITTSTWLAQFVGGGSAHSFDRYQLNNQTWTAPDDGTLRIDVGPEVGEYRLLVSEVALPPNPTPLTPEVPIEAQAKPYGLADWYAFQATAGHYYALYLPATTELIDTDGHTVLPSQYSNQRTFFDHPAPSITWLAPASGTYYLRVPADDLAASVSYTITEHDIVDDNAQTIDSATPLLLDQPATGYIYPGRQDYFSFDARAGQQYVIDAPADFTRVFVILDTDAKTILYDSHTVQYDDDYYYTSYQQTTTWTAPASGRYFIRVYSAQFNRDFDGEGPYTISLTLPRAPIAASPQTALPLSLSTETPGQTSYPFGPTFYSFPATAGQTYILTAFDYGYRPVLLSLFAPDGVTLLRSAAGESDSRRYSPCVEWTAPDTGTYFLSVNRNSAGPYTLEVMPILGPGPAAAQPLSSSTPIKITLPGDGTALWFSFRAEPGQSYFINTDYRSDRDAEFALFAPDAQTLLAGPAGFVEFEASLGGTYYVRVGGLYPSRPTTFQLDPELPILHHTHNPPLLPPSDNGDGDNPDDSDLPDSPDPAPQPPPDASLFHVRVSSDLPPYSPGQLFSFIATAGASYRLLTRLDSLSGSLFYLIDTDGQTILDWDIDRGSDGGSEIDWTAPGTDTYYLLVLATDPSDFGAYDLVAIETQNGSRQTRLLLLADTPSPSNLPIAPVAQALFNTRLAISAGDLIFPADDDVLNDQPSFWLE